MRFFKNNTLLFFTVLSVDLVLTIGLSALVTRFSPETFTVAKEVRQYDSLAENFFVSVLLAPVFETFLFQALPIHLVMKFLKSIIAALFISTLLFF